MLISCHWSGWCERPKPQPRKIRVSDVDCGAMRWILMHIFRIIGHGAYERKSPLNRFKSFPHMYIRRKHSPLWQASAKPGEPSPDCSEELSEDLNFCEKG